MVGTTPGASSRSQVQTVAPSIIPVGFFIPALTVKVTVLNLVSEHTVVEVFCVTNWGVCIKHFYCVQKSD